jgi:hypothetical protein
MLDRVRGAIARANPPQSPPQVPQYVDESLRLSKGTYGVTFSRSFALADLDQGPSPADAINYSYTASQAPVSRVEVELMDHSRKVVVAGTDKNAVQDLTTILDSVLRDHSSRVGGTRLRGFIEGITFLLGMSLCIGGLTALGMFPRPGLVVTLVGATLIWLGWGDRLARLLPGVFLVRGDISFARRYSAEIGFYGFVLGIIGLVLSIFFFALPSLSRSGGGQKGSLTVSEREPAPKPAQAEMPPADTSTSGASH